MEFWIAILKVISMIATGLFSALALITKYKNDDGKMTSWGKFAISGIVLSLGFSLGLFALETSKARTAAENAKIEAEATANVLKNILENAKTTADQQKINLEETNKLKTGLDTSLEQQRLNLNKSDLIAAGNERILVRSDEVAKGMENNLVAQKKVLKSNETILSGVTSTVKSQGDVLNNLGINLLASLSKDNPVKEAVWLIELKEDARNAKNAFELIFAEMPEEYKSVAVGKITLNPFSGMGGTIEYSYQDNKVVQTSPSPWYGVEEGYIPPYISLPRYFEDEDFLDKPYFSMNLNSSNKAANNAAIAYRDLLQKRTIGSLSLQFEKKFKTTEERERFVRDNKHLESVHEWDWDWNNPSLSEPAPGVRFKIPLWLKDRFFNYWRRNFQKGEINLFLDNTAYLMISCEVNSAEMTELELGILEIKFQTTTAPTVEVGIIEGN